MARIGFYVACTNAGSMIDARTRLRREIVTVDGIRRLYDAKLKRFERLHCALMWWMPMGYRECVVNVGGNPERRIDWRGMTDIDYDVWSRWVEARMGAVPGWSDIAAYLGTPWLETASVTPDADELKREERVYDFVQSAFGTRGGGPLLIADALYGCVPDGSRCGMTEAHWARMRRLRDRGMRLMGEGWPRTDRGETVPTLGWVETHANTIAKRAEPGRARFDDGAANGLRVLMAERPPEGLDARAPLETWAVDLVKAEASRWDVVLFEATLGAWDRAPDLADRLVDVIMEA